jgi:hypothetical protein
VRYTCLACFRASVSAQDVLQNSLHVALQEQQVEASGWHILRSADAESPAAQVSAVAAARHSFAG